MPFWHIFDGICAPIPLTRSSGPESGYGDQYPTNLTHNNATSLPEPVHKIPKWRYHESHGADQSSLSAEWVLGGVAPVGRNE